MLCNVLLLSALRRSESVNTYNTTDLHFGIYKRTWPNLLEHSYLVNTHITDFGDSFISALTYFYPYIIIRSVNCILLSYCHRVSIYTYVHCVIKTELMDCERWLAESLKKL